MLYTTLSHGGVPLFTTRDVDLRLHADFHEAEPKFLSMSPSVDEDVQTFDNHADLSALGRTIGHLIS